MTTEAAKIEVHKAWNSYNRTTDFRAKLKAEQRLLDACVDAGMSWEHGTPEHWAPIMLRYWAAPIKAGALWAGSGYARNYSLEMA